VVDVAEIAAMAVWTICSICWTAGDPPSARCSISPRANRAGPRGLCGNAVGIPLHPIGAVHGGFAATLLDFRAWLFDTHDTKTGLAYTTHRTQG